jgi:hypothetical protein
MIEWGQWLQNWGTWGRENGEGDREALGGDEKMENDNIKGHDGQEIDRKNSNLQVVNLYCME